MDDAKLDAARTYALSAGGAGFVQVGPVNQDWRHDILRLRQVVDADDIECPCGRTILLSNVRFEWNLVSRFPAVLPRKIRTHERPGARVQVALKLRFRN